MCTFSSRKGKNNLKAVRDSRAESLLSKVGPWPCFASIQSHGCRTTQQNPEVRRVLGAELSPQQIWKEP
jgi:hypothetical protein